MGRRTPSPGLVALVVLVLAVLVGACADVDDGAATDPTTSASAPDAGADPTGPSSTAAPDDARPAAPGDLPDGRDVVVTSVTDGDTFRAGEERVRLTGIDTPEVSGPVECFGAEASDALAGMIPPGTEVRLVRDVEPEDRYDRTLAYVYRLSDGAFVNLALARAGLAEALSIAPNVAHADDVDTAVAEARAAGRGLWSACPEADGEAAPSTTAPGGPPGDPGGAGCDPSYPDVCIPPAPPDLDCADVADRGFTVLAPDPHRFDGGGDGVGCEAG